MMPFFLSTFLLFDTEYSLGSSSIFHSPVLESVTALGIPDSFHWRMVFRNQYKGARCTHCYFRALLLLGLLGGKSLEIYQWLTGVGNWGEGMTQEVAPENSGVMELFCIMTVHLWKCTELHTKKVWILLHLH